MNHAINSIPVEESRLIAALRLPLSVLVVFIHVPSDSLSHRILCDNLCAVAVPMFFMISGYCYYISIKKFSFVQYGKKLYSRIYSLLIPYCIWNIIALSILYAEQIFMMKNLYRIPNAKLVQNYGISDFFAAFGVYPAGIMPCDYPLWYIRDLMILMILAPLGLLFIRCCKTILLPLLLMGIAISPRLAPTEGSWLYICYFLLGGTVAGEFPAFLKIFQKKSAFIILLYGVLSFIAFFHVPMISAAILYGILFWCILGNWLQSRFPFLCTAAMGAFAFFLYCSHSLIIGIINKVIPQTFLQQDISYLIRGTLVIGVSYGLFVIFSHCGKYAAMLLWGKRTVGKPVELK